MHSIKKAGNTFFQRHLIGTDYKAGRCRRLVGRVNPCKEGQNPGSCLFVQAFGISFLRNCEGDVHVDLQEVLLANPSFDCIAIG